MFCKHQLPVERWQKSIAGNKVNGLTTTVTSDDSLVKPMGSMHCNMHVCAPGLADMNADDCNKYILWVAQRQSEVNCRWNCKCRKINVINEKKTNIIYTDQPFIPITDLCRNLVSLYRLLYRGYYGQCKVQPDWERCTPNKANHKML